MKFFLQNIKNGIDFFLRNKFVFSRKDYIEKNENKEGLFVSQIKQEKENYLFYKYNLEYLKNNSTKQNYLENLYTLDLLDKNIEPIYKDKLRVLDIGCKNWFYAKGEYFFFKKFCAELELDGIELDATRLYSNFYTRGEVAKFHIKNLKEVRYISKDFLMHEEHYNYIIWFLPFIFEEPLLKWGLPLKYFEPQRMLKHAFDLLLPGGKILIINQGYVEFGEQKKLCKKLNIKCTPFGEVENMFLEYNKNQFLTIIEK